MFRYNLQTFSVSRITYLAQERVLLKHPNIMIQDLDCLKVTSSGPKNPHALKPECVVLSDFHCASAFDIKLISEYLEIERLGTYLTS